MNQVTLHENKSPGHSLDVRKIEGPYFAVEIRYHGSVIEDFIITEDEVNVISESIRIIKDGKD